VECRCELCTIFPASCALLQVTGHTGEENLPACLEGADLVVIPAGVPRKPGMTRDDLFNINAGIVKKLAEKVAQHCPQVRKLCIITC
jgi:malate dehydrogenase